MDHQRCYDLIIERARNRATDVYKEQHHIIPRALGGSDDPANLVDLTYREHFLVHWILTKTCEGKSRSLMAFALHCMTFDRITGRRVTGWQIEVAKRALKREFLIRAKARYQVRRLLLKNKMLLFEAPFIGMTPQ